MTKTVSLSFEDALAKTSPLRADDSLADQFFTERAVQNPSPLKQICATIMASMLVGTGGVATGATIGWLPHDSVDCRVLHADQKQQGPSLLLDTRERMAGLRRYFSLNVTDLSRILRVERPTIYAWLNGSSEPHPANLKRLERIYSLARVWRAMSSMSMGAYVRERSEDGRSLLDYLAEEELNEQAIRQAFSLIKSRLDQERTARSARRQSVDESARLHGFPDIPQDVQKKNFDDATSL